MSESRLYQLLKSFPYANGNMKKLTTEFEKIAKAAFHSGHFLINKGTENEFTIEMVCIEFYYHELEGKIKDTKKILRDFKQDIFPVGSLLPHNFGIDVNFDDNVEKKFRASFFN